MKKHGTLAQQVIQAQKTFDSWPDSRKSTFRLEGSDMFLARSSAVKENHCSNESTHQKKKTSA